MRYFYLIFSVLLIYSSFLFAQNDFNQFDLDGNRHGIWKKYYSGSDQLRYEGQFEHGKEIGFFKFYCEKCKDKPTTIKEFNAKDNTAYVKFYTLKGKLVSEGKMEGKNRIGEWIYYHEKSHERMSRENYVDGVLDGKKITYYPNGKITEEVNFKMGIKEGTNNFYSPEGVLIKKLIYKNDKLQGEASYFDASGVIVIEGFYKDDKKHGLWKYYKDGKLVKEEIYPKPIEKGN